MRAAGDVRISKKRKEGISTKDERDFRGGPVVEDFSFQRRGSKFNPWSES